MSTATNQLLPVALHVDDASGLYVYSTHVFFTMCMFCSLDTLHCYAVECCTSHQLLISLLDDNTDLAVE